VQENTTSCAESSGRCGKGFEISEAAGQQAELQDMAWLLKLSVRALLMAHFNFSVAQRTG
jgi:hypothetical protein